MATVNTEKRLIALENELKALKAICPISGRLAKMYVQTSDSFTIGGGATLHAAVFSFTPKYGRGQNNLITLTPNVTSTYAGIYWDSIPIYANLPQDNSGTVTIKIFNLINTDVVKIIASGTSEGTFARIS